MQVMHGSGAGPCGISDLDRPRTIGNCAQSELWEIQTWGPGMKLWWSLTVLLAVLTSTGASATTPMATIRFATSCAACHEGECSGRLSFTRQPRVAFDHIRRYAGPANDELAQQLYETLEQMKSDCSYPPLQAPDPGREMDTGEIERYRDAWSSAYFLPLHGLRPLRYRLLISFTGDGAVRVEVIDAEFDPLLDERLVVGDTPLTVTLPASDPGHGYLRLRPCGEMRIRKLRFELAE